MGKTKIEWTDATWNPVTGCTKVSQGCKHCYAERFAKRLGYDFSQVELHPERLEIPLHWKKPRRIFVNSMSDLFHRDVPVEFIAEVFNVMARASHHTFQLLTKRARRLASLAPFLPWPENLWVGVSVETADYLWRIGCLREVPAAVRFLSLEPLLGPIPDLPLGHINWVIAGGESGPGARPMRAEWARSVRDQSLAAGVPFFFKQWGGVQRTKAGRRLDGRTWDQYPQVASL
jgi:protein gp37